MKSYTYTQTVNQQIDSVTCNMCGTPVKKNEFDYPDDYISIEKQWGYHSPYDGETHRLDICLDCYSKLTSMLKIPPEKE